MSEAPRWPLHAREWRRVPEVRRVAVLSFPLRRPARRPRACSYNRKWGLFSGEWRPRWLGVSETALWHCGMALCADRAKPAGQCRSRHALTCEQQGKVEGDEGCKKQRRFTRFKLARSKGTREYVQVEGGRVCVAVPPTAVHCESPNLGRLFFTIYHNSFLERRRN